jgi:DNA-binding transcriptional ArsR family regulator
VTDHYGELLHIDERGALELRRGLPDPQAGERAALRCRALGDPTRLSLACSLRATDELCVCDLAWIAGRPQNLVSHHMQVLRRAQLVTGRREGKMTMYGLTAEGRALLDTVAGQEPRAAVARPPRHAELARAKPRR